MRILDPYEHEIMATTQASTNAKAHPFKPGQSGNPSGRPKDPPDAEARAAKHIPAAIRAIVDLMQNSKDDRIRLAAAKEILDRGIGKSKQATAPGANNKREVQDLNDAELAQIAGVGCPRADPATPGPRGSDRLHAVYVS
ncbi:MAG: DUF5681 domain-containing protein [Hyphomicrobiaceae bacterium]